MAPLALALWMLCALGAAVFGASAASSRLGVLGATIGFVLTVILPFEPGPVWVGGLTIVAASLALVRPGWPWLPSFGGGLAAILGELVRADGIPAVPALLFAAAIPAAACFLASRNREFAPSWLREEAMLLVLLFATVLTAAPGVMAGWTSAVALNMNTGGVAPAAIPVWVILVGAVSVALGGLWALWRRS